MTTICGTTHTENVKALASEALPFSRPHNVPHALEQLTYINVRALLIATC